MNEAADVLARGHTFSAPSSVTRRGVMTDRPIIFSGPMVSALLDGRKTQTRRLATSPLRRCAAGDRLYVREAWAPNEGVLGGVVYRAKYGAASSVTTYDLKVGDHPVIHVSKWRPSIHMPRWASRLTLIVEKVRVEPLQAITPEDAEAEGPERYALTWRGAFHALWNSLHAEPGERWEDNPAVVALTFRVLRGNIDDIRESAS